MATSAASGRRLNEGSIGDRRQFLAAFSPRSAEADEGLAESAHWIRVHRCAMACRFEVTLAATDGAFVPAAISALDEVDRLEGDFGHDTFDSNDDPSEYLDRQPDEPLAPITPIPGS